MRKKIAVGIKLVLPVGLIFAGLLLMTGCFFIPNFNPTIRGTNVAGKVGDAQSKRPILVGKATKQQI